jgi:hypothetical protein
MRRETEWITLDDVDVNLTAASTAVLVLIGNAAFIAEAPFTIVRTHLAFHAGSDQIAARERWLVSIGCMVGSVESIVAGVASLPTPQTEQGSDFWFLHHTLIGTAPAAPVAEEGRLAQIDSKAMRRVEDGMNLAILVETGSVSAGAQVGATGRMLIKLH